jgi:hypothetical protein
MAMDSDTLGEKWADVIIKASVVPPTPDMIVNIQRFWKNMAKEAVGHINDNAEVPPGISVSTPVGPGSTTGTGKVN